MKNPIFNIGDNVFYYNKWSNEIEQGEIIGVRQAKLNWDYKIRYEIYNNMHYVHWIEEKHMGRDEQSLFKFLV